METPGETVLESAPTPSQQSLSFLSLEEQGQVPEPVRVKVLNAFAELARNFHNAVNSKQKERVSYEQRLVNVEGLLKEHREKAETLNAQLMTERKTTEEYIERYRKALTSTNELEDSVRNRSVTRTKWEQLTADKDELVSIVEKRNYDIEKLTLDVKNLSDQLQSATVAKIEAQVKLNELTSKETELDYKEKQIEKERYWVSKQVKLLNEELDRKNAEIIETQREANLKYLNLQAEVSEKEKQAATLVRHLQRKLIDAKKTEKQIVMLKAELSTCQQNLAQTDLGLSTMAHERDTLRDAKSRLEAERDLFQREQSTQKILQTHLADTKNNLEMRISAYKITLENQVESLEQDQLLSLMTQKSSLRQAESTAAPAAAALNKSANEGGPPSLDISFSASFIEAQDQSDQARKTTDQWMQLIRYMRRQKEIAYTKTEMAEGTVQSLDSQLQFVQKQYEEVKAKLSQDQDSSHYSIITYAKQAELLRKDETLSTLTDTNRMLTEEKDVARREIQSLKSRLEALERELGPLRVTNAALESRSESLLDENSGLKLELSRWLARAAILLENSTKINPEEWKKLTTEKDGLTRSLATLQETNKRQVMESGRLVHTIKTLQSQVAAFQASVQALSGEKKTLTEEAKRSSEEKLRLFTVMEALRAETERVKAALTAKDKETEKSDQNLARAQAEVEEQNGVVRLAKAIAGKYRKSHEDSLNENDAHQGQKVTLEAAASTCSSAVASTVAETESSRQQASEVEATLKTASGSQQEGTSTSHMEDSETSDSSEQVSSLDPSNHHPVLTVTLIRSQSQQQEQVQQSSQVQAGSSHAKPQTVSVGREEHSPSTSTSGPRPAQSSKRTRDNEIETSEEFSQLDDEPGPKRTRVTDSYPMHVDSEAEVMAHEQEEREAEGEEEEELSEATPSVPTGRTSRPMDEEDDDSDVIVIESDEEEEEFEQRPASGRRDGVDAVDENDVDAEEEVQEDDLEGQERDEDDEDGDAEAEEQNIVLEEIIILD